MNTFNRVVLILLCLTLLVVAVAVVVLTWTIPNRTINWLADAVQWMDGNDGDLEKALLTTGSAFVGLVATIVLLIELIPRRGPAVQVVGLASGNATLSTAMIGQRIEEAVCQVPHVAEVRANVKAKRHGVLVDLDLHVDPEANLATVTDEACEVASEVLTERVHVNLLKPPTARLHYRELRLQGRGNANGSRRGTQVRPGVPVSPPREPIAPEMSPLPRAPVSSNGEGAGVAVAEAPEPPELPESLAHRNEALDEDVDSPLDAESATIEEDFPDDDRPERPEAEEKTT